MADHLTAQLNDAETHAKALLSLVTSSYLRGHLELAARDVDEARIWLSLNDQAIAGSCCLNALGRIDHVRKVIAIYGYNAQAADER